MSRVLPFLLVLLSVGCERPAEQTKDRELAVRVLSGLLAYPHSSLVTVSSGQDAAQVTLTAPADVGRVAAWYRQMLTLNGWELQNDAPGSQGGVTIYAEKGQRPLWIMLNHEGPGATRYTLVGAELPQDSTRAAQRSGSSMSSNRIQRR